MERNTCILYSEVTDVYKKLLLFIPSKGFKVKESNEKYFFLRAKKNSIFFWRNLRLELHIQSVEKKKVEIKIMLYKIGLRQPKMEAEYIIEIEKFLESRR